VRTKKQSSVDPKSTTHYLKVYAASRTIWSMADSLKCLDLCRESRKELIMGKNGRMEVRKRNQLKGMKANAQPLNRIMMKKKTS
jgi:hypothetical protein